MRSITNRYQTCRTQPVYLRKVSNRSLNMGSVISVPTEIENTLEERMREKALEKRGMGSDKNLKLIEIQKKMLAPFSKGERKNLLSDNFDAIVLDDAGEKGGQTGHHYHDGLAMVLCEDPEYSSSIKDFLVKIFPHLATARWPRFKMTGGQSIVKTIKDNMCQKIIGYTDFFLLYTVVPEHIADNLEWEIKNTVGYFLKRHKGALKEIPKLFIFEHQGPLQNLLPLALEGCENVTVIVTDGKSNYKTLTEKGTRSEFKHEDFKSYDQDETEMASKTSDF